MSRTRLARLGGEPEYARELKLLVDYRRQLTSERTRIVNRLHAGEVRDVRRFADRARFARLNATAPIPASSGHTKRMRLNPGGNRQLNHAFHIIALTQSRCDPRAREYIARKMAAGASHRDAIRSLKRRLSDAIYQLLRADQRAAEAVLEQGEAVTIACGPMRSQPLPRPRRARRRSLPKTT